MKTFTVEFHDVYVVEVSASSKEGAINTAYETHGDTSATVFVSRDVVSVESPCTVPACEQKKTLTAAEDVENWFCAQHELEKEVYQVVAEAN